MNFTSILIVDDNEGDHFLIADSIESLNPTTEILHAYDGSEALSLLSKTEVEYILLDINMPGMNGLEFLQEYDKRKDTVDVSILTSSSQPSDKEECLNYGFVKNYIVKPISNDALTQL